MGEAKRRKLVDPNYGKPKPSPRGLVISCPMEVQGQTIHLRSSNLDPLELRTSTLFWDKLVWPASRFFYIESGPDAQFLETAGVLSRPDYTINGDQARAMAQAQVQAFADLDTREPGQWSLAQGENSVLVREGLLEAKSGVLLELQNAIPVPDKDVPLNEVLEFKHRRSDELHQLRAELDGLVAAIEAATDKDAELQNCVGRVDAACADALKVAHEWQFPVRVANLKSSFDLRPVTPAIAAAGAYATAAAHGLSTSAAALSAFGGAAAALAPALKLGGDFGWRGLRRRLGPYRYVYQFHNELF